MDSWVSTDKQYPEPFTPVLIAWGERVLIGSYHPADDLFPEGEWNTESGFLATEHIAHWMPLPELPRG